MVDYLIAEKSRIYIFKKPICCHICAHDIFTPLETYTDVEKPGIKVVFVHNTAICQQCGFVMQFGDPSYYDGEKDMYRWAFDQELIEEQPPLEPHVPYIDAKTMDKYKRCIPLALQLLIRRNEAPGELLNLCGNDEYIAITQYFNATYEEKYSQFVERDCLALLFNRLMEKRIVNPDELVKVLQSEEDLYLEAFLKASIEK